jgi:hypothetical protein
MFINTDTNQSNSQDAQALEKNLSKEQVKAGFSLLDHFVKLYNSGDTYIKRGLTLFGLGSILAGATFGGGQQLPSSQHNTSVERSPSIIYVQVPTQTASAPVKVQPSTSVPQQVASQTILSPRPSTSVPQQVASRKILPTKPASVQRRTVTPVRIESAANRTMLNPKPTSTPKKVQPLTKATQRVTTQKIVRAKSAPAPTKAKTPVRPVSRTTNQVALSRTIATNTSKQMRGAIKEVTGTIAQVKQVVAPPRPTNKNN